MQKKKNLRPKHVLAGVLSNITLFAKMSICDGEIVTSLQNSVISLAWTDISQIFRVWKRVKNKWWNVMKCFIIYCEG